VIIENDRTYKVAENGDILVAKRQIEATPATSLLPLSALESTPVAVSGLERNDFAIFARVSDDIETKNIGFLVANYRKNGAATLVAYDLVAEHPRRHVTDYMKRLIRLADIDELRQFNIHELLDHIDLSH
jgi:hypothetical protein